MLLGYRGFDAIDQGGCGPTGRSWRCGPCDTTSSLEGFGQAGSTSAIGVEQAALAKNVSAAQSVIMGVATGLTVWALTHFLEKRVLKGRW